MNTSDWSTLEQETLQARVRFSDRFAREMLKEENFSVAGLTAYLARVELGESIDEQHRTYVPCTNCPYLSYSFHESSAHARLHPRKPCRERHPKIYKG